MNERHLPPSEVQVPGSQGPPNATLIKEKDSHLDPASWCFATLLLHASERESGSSTGRGLTTESHFSMVTVKGTRRGEKNGSEILREMTYSPEFYTKSNYGSNVKLE